MRTTAPDVLARRLTTEQVHELLFPGRRIARPQPAVSDLVARAIEDTDFLADVTPGGDLEMLAANAADQAAEQWEADVGDGGIITLELLLEVRAALLRTAAETLAQREQDRIDAMADAIEAGDLDQQGEPLTYGIYRWADR